MWFLRILLISLTFGLNKSSNSTQSEAHIWAQKWLSVLYYFGRVAVEKTQKLGGSYNRTLFNSQFWRLEFWDQMLRQFDFFFFFPWGFSLLADWCLPAGCSFGNLYACTFLLSLCLLISLSLKLSIILYRGKPSFIAFLKALLQNNLWGMVDLQKVHAKKATDHSSQNTGLGACIPYENVYIPILVQVDPGRQQRIISSC